MPGGDRRSRIGEQPFVDQGEQYENEMSEHKIDLVERLVSISLIESHEWS